MHSLRFKYSNIIPLVFLPIILLAGCANLDPQFKSIGSSILSSTGLVTGSQANAAMEAGEKIGKAATKLNDEQEYYLGRSVSAMVFAKYRPLRDRPVQEYINKVGLVVANVSDKPATFSGYHFIVLDSDEINALSAPGGFVFVTRGLIHLLPDEEALAGVLAHEVGHIVKEHGVHAISNANLTQALLIIGKEAAASRGGSGVQELTNVFGDSVNQVFETLLTKGFSRSQEYEADAYGAELLKRAGYNQGGLITALNKLKENSSGDSSSGWSATHPKPSKRISELEDVVPSNISADPSQALRTSRFQKALSSIIVRSGKS